MESRPILFNSEMVKEILNGFKTQTRRAVKPQPLYGVGSCHYCNSGFAHLNKLGSCECRPIKCPYGQVGDTLWVRETWSASTDLTYIHKPDVGNNIWYKADNNRPTWAEGKWRPSIFMPRWASRITLLVTGVQVERVQDISWSDSYAEGIHEASDPQGAFGELWDTINAKRGYSWDSNPWVWVVKFEVMAP